MLRIERYGNSRFWALYDGQDLVAVTVYKRGAQEVRRRLAAQPPAATEAAAQAAAVEAAAQQAAQAMALARQAQAAAQTARTRAQPAGEAGAAGGYAACPASPAWSRHQARPWARLAATVATNGSATTARWPAAPAPTRCHPQALRRDQRERCRAAPATSPSPGIFPARRYLWGKRRRFGQGWRVFEPPAGLGLDWFCGATTLAQPGRKEACYLTRRGLAACLRGGVCGGSCPCMRQQCLAARQRRSGTPAATPYQPLR